MCRLFLKKFIKQLTELSKCPACYGTTACAKIFDSDLSFEFYDLFTTLSHLFAAKNVFYATLEGTRVVLKKLAHNNEFYLFDRMICESKKLKHLCIDNINKNNNVEIFDEEYYLSLIVSEVSLNVINGNSKLILCPTTGHLKNIFNLSQNYTFYENDYINLWTLIKINPEPIILQILKADEGWPVAKFYGACGRLVVEEYAGLPLTVYYQEGWLWRAKIAIRLLESAHAFTFRSPEYSFYLTDLSSDNIVIDESDNPVFIDLENIIILHRNIPTEEQPQHWNSIHTSDSIDCDNCFSFSPNDICSHHISDHNYYSVCQYILSSKNENGFLHSIPSEILKNYQELKIMIDECASPRRSKSRIEAGNQLKEILQRVLRDLN
ncbi:divergent protein kinase domain 2A isoform X2 [Cotesia typhae]|uniref:divergent protein kinase domain 2A isoform X2 n=1 Tax=Cotesia typhae TaxID=2053667 RepID=UPI003D69EA31